MAQNLSKLAKDLRFIETFTPKFSIYYQNICSYLGSIDAYVLHRILPNLAHLLIFCVFISVLCGVNKEVKENNNNKTPSPQEDIRYSYNFLDCVYASFNNGKVSNVSNKKFPYFKAI
jgi:hypothetical protein